MKSSYTTTDREHHRVGDRRERVVRGVVGANCAGFILVTEFRTASRKVCRVSAVVSAYHSGTIAKRKNEGAGFVEEEMEERGVQSAGIDLLLVGKKVRLRQDLQCLASFPITCYSTSFPQRLAGKEEIIVAMLCLNYSI